MRGCVKYPTATTESCVLLLWPTMHCWTVDVTTLGTVRGGNNTLADFIPVNTGATITDSESLRARGKATLVWRETSVGSPSTTSSITTATGTCSTMTSMKSHYEHFCRPVGILWMIGWLSLSEAVMPQSQVDLFLESDGSSGGSSSASTTSFLASNALYGPLAPMMERTRKNTGTRAGNNKNNNENDNNINRYEIVHLTEKDIENNMGLCQDPSSSTQPFQISGLEDAIVLIPRGNCSYEQKTWNAQQNGAKGVIIYNTLAARYGYNETTSDIEWPLSQHDYECQNGKAMIPMKELGFWSHNSTSNPNGINGPQQPYYSALDDMLTGDDFETNLCFKYAMDDSFKHCASKRCFLTGNVTTTTKDDSNQDATDMWEACCAWDQHLYLFGDTSMDKQIQITIPTVMVTMAQGQELLNQWKSHHDNDSDNGNNNNIPLYGSISSRWKLEFNLSALLIWMLGVSVCAFASYHSAGDYHLAISRRSQQRKRRRNGGRERISADSEENSRPSPLPVARSALHDEQLELEPIHAIGFIFMASSSLVVLFYFEIYGIVKAFYAFGCTNAVIQILLVPKVERIFAMFRLPKKLIYHAQGEEPFIPDITNIEAIAMVVGYVWGGVWLYLAYTLPHNTTTTFFWMSQNIFGACMCCLFLQIMKLNSIQVASVLLIVAFFYDIFFVFLTPYLTKGGESIMITVATSGGPPTAGELWCEKYPSDPNCQGGDPLPMLLTVPRFFDYEGGSSLLGLGDIVLPGLLLSFGARLDAAHKLVAIAAWYGEGAGSGGTPATVPLRPMASKMGYLGPLVVAYGVGLLMANVAVYMMRMGQPALLYLVPCCLGTMAALGYFRGELGELWHGPTILDEADIITYGGRPPQQTPSGNDGTTSGDAVSTGTNGDSPDGSTGIMVELSFQQSSSSPNTADDDELGHVPLLESHLSLTTTTSSSTTAASMRGNHRSTS